jgi:hypothetical protein
MPQPQTGGRSMQPNPELSWTTTAPHCTADLTIFLCEGVQHRGVLRVSLLRHVRHDTVHPRRLCTRDDRR